MKSKSFFPNHNNFPQPGNKDIAERKISQWSDLEHSTKTEALKSFVRDSLNDDGSRHLLKTIFGNSPYLTQIIMKNPHFFMSLCVDGFEITYEKIKSDLLNIEVNNAKKDSIKATLRRLKQKFSLLIAIADITETWNLKKITAKLSELAELSINTCVHFLLLEAYKNKQIALDDTNKPTDGSGLIILAVGKLGSHELNYSSDVDLILLYDENNCTYIGKTSTSSFFVHFTQELSDMLQTRTSEGYVFRVDLRLRPDPGSTAIAISTDAAEQYYETVGQNWERAAMIKARPIAGDIAAGEKYMLFLKRYVWRKYLDFESIQDIHSIKRQIDSKVSKLDSDLHGHNVKVGHGGIREIEFFVQTQQLIWGGREESLQVYSTCDALERLEHLGKIDATTRKELSESYCFYRTIEHRLQMIADQQTHSLPESDEKIKELALFLNFKNRKDFITELKETIYLVKGHYSKLFEQSPSLASGAPGVEGSLVFTGIENDPETLITLKKMGFAKPDQVSEIVRGWHHGRRRSTRTKRVREILTEFMPLVLKSFSETANPNLAIQKFDDFLTKIPASVQLFSLCHSNPALLDLIAEIMGGYPYIASNLSRNPSSLEYVLSIEFFESLPNREQLDSNLKNSLSRTTDTEEVLNITREWTHDIQFRIGIQLIKKQITSKEACSHLSNIADVVLINLYDHVHHSFAQNYGTANGYSLAVLVMGKLGSSEITFGSDIDMIFVYDQTTPEYEDPKTNLSPSEYLTRVSKRYISAISALTPYGKLYDVDTRLRPSGNDGPLVSNIEAYSDYYDSSAWIWEFMALTRARILIAPDGLRNKLDNIIKKQLRKEREKKKLVEYVLDMQRRVRSTHNSKNLFDIKHIEGGLMDLEYIVQFLQILYGHKHPDILTVNMNNCLKKLHHNNIIDEKDCTQLQETLIFYQSLQSVLRLTESENTTEENMSEGMKKILSSMTNSKNFSELKKNLEKSQKTVQKIFRQCIT